MYDPRDDQNYIVFTRTIVVQPSSSIGNFLKKKKKAFSSLHTITEISI